MNDRNALIAALNRGETLNYLLFWGHRPSASGAITASCFSQWFDAPFVDGDVRYATAEHYMMARKAVLFGDTDARDEILRTTDPAKAKAIGRRVRDFDDTTWNAHRYAIVVAANALKFGQHAKLRHYLLGTRDTVLVEASPVDAIWGIGLAADAPDARDPRRWRGLNLLGFALMDVRERLRAKQER